MLGVSLTSVHNATHMQPRCTTLAATAWRPGRLSPLLRFLDGLKERSAAAANAAQHLFDSLLPRNLLGLQLIIFGRAPLRPWPAVVGSHNRTGGVTSSGESRRLCPLRRHGRLWRRLMVHPLQLLDLGATRLIARPAAAKARTQADQQKHVAESNHRHTIRWVYRNTYIRPPPSISTSSVLAPRMSHPS